MALIQVTPELLTSKAGDVRKLKAEHEATMQRLSQLILGLNEVWKGEAQDAFVQKYQSMDTQFKNFAEMLEGYAKLMDKAASDIQQTDQALKGTMQSFG
jgi:WXG100 family type VII secretion target